MKINRFLTLSILFLVSAYSQENLKTNIVVQDNNTNNQIEKQKTFLPMSGGFMQLRYQFFNSTKFKNNPDSSVDFKSVLANIRIPYAYIKKEPFALFSFSYNWNEYNLINVPFTHNRQEVHQIDIGFEFIRNFSKKVIYYSRWGFNIKSDFNAISHRDIGWSSINAYIYRYQKWIFAIGLNLGFYIDNPLVVQTLGRVLLLPVANVIYQNRHWEINLNFPNPVIRYAPIWGILFELGIRPVTIGGYHLSGRSFNRSDYVLNTRGWKVIFDFEFLLNRNKKHSLQIWQFFELNYLFDFSLNIEQPGEVETRHDLRNNYQILIGFYIKV